MREKSGTGESRVCRVVAERVRILEMSGWKFLALAACALVGFVGATSHKVFKEEVRSLSELPLKRLIEIKTSLLETDATTDEGETRRMDANRVPETSTALSLPMALPFKRTSTKKALWRRGDYPWDDKGRDSKISKIFQLSVTALSFLAFGGYLMTLIMTAVRRNAATPGTPSVIVLSGYGGLQKVKRPKRRAWLIDPMDNDFDTDRMYRGMIMLSQGYTMFNNHV